MSVHMKTQTTGKLAEIDFKIKLPLPELDLMVDTLKGFFALTGHEVDSANTDDDDVLYTSDEVFPESTPGMTLQGFRGREELTQEELAERLGITQARISALENGTRAISVAMAKRLGKIFDITYKVFL